LEQQKSRWEKNGIRIAALSYDSVDVMRSFANRKNITYPLLSDRGSEIIRRLGVLNENYRKDDLRYDGVAWPGTFMLDNFGVITAKYFEDEHHERYTSANLLVRHFGEVDGSVQTEIETPHLKVRSSASNAVVGVGTRIALVLDVELKPNMHVYAPSASGGYIPVQWTIEESKAWLARPVEFPKAKTLYLKLLKESFPVYENHFRIVRDFTVGEIFEHRAVASDGSLTVKGAFRYQACSDRECYPPRSVPLGWTFRTQVHDQIRVEEKYQIENLRRQKR
jgi:hypothetical protein